MTRTYYAPAKINLWLRVFASDGSGYHPLDTLFCAIDLRDQLDIRDGDGLQLEVAGADVGTIEDNLVYRAAAEYFKLIGEQPAVHIHLQKNIPAGAGLGGGSSDAAATLIGLQDRCQHRASRKELHALAARLGSDVPFFLAGATFARASGRGDVVQAIDPLPERHVLLVTPNFPIATRDAYRWLDESGALTAPESPLAAPRDWSDVDRNATNTFETVLFDRYPIFSRITSFLRDNGARAAHISGSGSSLFGLFDDANAARAARQVLAMDPTLAVTLTRTLGA